jgi:hypothetical protein
MLNQWISQRFNGKSGPKEGVVNSVDDAREAVRQRYKNRPTGLK